MESNTIVDNIKENNILLYNSILQKIRHKPLIVSNIFSYVKDQPYKFMALIEKDITLKNSINSLFFNTKINNKLSEELNENIRLIKTYSKISSIIKENKNKEKEEKLKEEKAKKEKERKEKEEKLKEENPEIKLMEDQIDPGEIKPLTILIVF